MRSFETSHLWTFGTLQRPVRPGRRRSVARSFTVVSLLFLTSQTSLGSNLFLDPGETGILAPKPFMGGHGFRYEFAEQSGMFVIEDLDGAGNIQTRATLDFDGTILGEPSWIIEFATPSGLHNLNEAFGDLVLPLGVGPDGTVQSSHFHGSSGDVWFAGGTVIVANGDGSWILFPSGGSQHASAGPLPPPDPPALASFRNQTGGVVDIHSLVPEPRAIVLLLLASAVLACRRIRAIRGTI